MIEVTSESSESQRRAVAEFGERLRRESDLSADFALYDPSDPDARAYLFGSDGAALFRPLDGGWVLCWVWLAPHARRRGILSKAWPQFRAWFGDFAIAAPTSDAMKAFLSKHPAERAEQ